MTVFIVRFIFDIHIIQAPRRWFLYLYFILLRSPFPFFWAPVRSGLLEI